MRTFVAMMVVFLCLVSIEAQDKVPLKGEFIDDCGELIAASESQIYNTAEGIVVKIVDGNTIIFESDSISGNQKKERFIVDLAGIEASKATNKFLKENILNKKVTVKGNIFEKYDKSRIGILYGDTVNLLEVNCFMLRNGISKYKEFNGGNIVPNTKSYTYLKLEEEAKKAKLGIWAN